MREPGEEEARPEMILLDEHLKDTYLQIQKLHKNTPTSVIFFPGSVWSVESKGQEEGL